MFLLDPRSAWGRSATTWQLHSWLSLLGSSSPSPSGCTTIVSASQPLPSHPVTKSPQTGPCQHRGGAAPPGGEEHNHHGHPPGLAHQLLSTQPGAGEDNTPLKVSNWLVVSFLLQWRIFMSWPNKKKYERDNTLNLFINRFPIVLPTDCTWSPSIYQQSDKRTIMPTC